jgi:hypothetical protein
MRKLPVEENLVLKFIIIPPQELPDKAVKPLALAMGI